MRLLDPTRGPHWEHDVAVYNHLSWKHCPFWNQTANERGERGPQRQSPPPPSKNGVKAAKATKSAKAAKSAKLLEKLAKSPRHVSKSSHAVLSEHPSVRSAKKRVDNPA